MMKQLPDNAAAYKRTPEFNQSTIPNGLLKNHQTKAGVWGKINILEGRLLYLIEETNEQFELDATTAGVVEPAVLHHIKPLGSVRFYVEFYREMASTLPAT
jgi:tellurite resistance-related uncharacterized protein